MAAAQAKEGGGPWKGRPQERWLPGILNRFLQVFARMAPGARTLRPMLHRWRGVKIGKGAWIGYDSILETAHPQLVTIGDRADIGIRVVIIAHMRESNGVVIEEDAYVGPGALILPNVVIGRGALVAAGSVVTTSVPPLTLVQGNPAKPVARLKEPFREEMSIKELSRLMRPL